MHTSSLRMIAAFGALAVLAGCATKPQLRGAVVPMVGGGYQSVVKASSKEEAFKGLDGDAKLTCGKPGGTFSAPTPGKYAILSQSAKERDGNDVSSGNKVASAGMKLGMRYLGLERDDLYELTTVFKCE